MNIFVGDLPVAFSQFQKNYLKVRRLNLN